MSPLGLELGCCTTEKYTTCPQHYLNEWEDFHSRNPEPRAGLTDREGRNRGLLQTWRRKLLFPFAADTNWQFPLPCRILVRSTLRVYEYQFLKLCLLEGREFSVSCLATEIDQSRLFKLIGTWMIIVPYRFLFVDQPMNVTCFMQRCIVQTLGRCSRNSLSPNV